MQRLHVVPRVLAVCLLLGFSTSALSAQQTFFGEDTDGSEGSRATLNHSLSAETLFKSHLVGVGTENFEGFTTGTTSPLNLTFPGAGNAVLGGNGAISTVNSGTNGVGRYAISGSNFWETDAGGNFVIDFMNPVAAFGFYGIDIGDFLGTIQLSFLTESGDVVVPVPHTVGGSGGSIMYFGYINTANPFTRVSFSSSYGSGDFFAFDDMTIGSVEQVREVVPEPATLLLLGTGLFGVGVVARRRREDELS